MSLENLGNYQFSLGYFLSPVMVLASTGFLASVFFVSSPQPAMVSANKQAKNPERNRFMKGLQGFLFQQVVDLVKIEKPERWTTFPGF